MNTEINATPIQTANQFTASNDPFATYLIGEEMAFKLNTGELYPFSKPELWMQLLSQGAIVKVKDLQNEGLESQIITYIGTKDWEGLKDFLNNALRPNIVEAAKAEIAEQKRLKEANHNHAASYSDTVSAACLYLHNEGKNNSKIVKELGGLSLPTVQSHITKAKEKAI